MPFRAATIVVATLAVWPRAGSLPREEGGPRGNGRATIKTGMCLRGGSTYGCSGAEAPWLTQTRMYGATVATPNTPQYMVPPTPGLHNFVHTPQFERFGDDNAGKGAMRFLALAYFGVLACGANAARMHARNRSLRWALSGFAYSNAVLALSGVVGSTMDVMGVPIFALLSIPSLLADRTALPALTLAIASLADLEAAAHPARYLPGGPRTVQMLAGGVGILTVHSTLVGVWSSDMRSDLTWAQLGLVSYKSLPPAPTLTVLTGPLILMLTSLSVGLTIYQAGRGAGLMAGAVALTSGILGPEASCVWSSHLGQMLLAFAVFARLHGASWVSSRKERQASAGAGPAGAAQAPFSMALRAAAAVVGSSKARAQLALALGLKLPCHAKVAEQDAGDSGTLLRCIQRARHLSDIVLIVAAALAPQLVAHGVRYVQRSLTLSRIETTIPGRDTYAPASQVQGVVQTDLHSPQMGQMSAANTMKHWREGDTLPDNQNTNWHQHVTPRPRMQDQDATSLAHVPLAALRTSRPPEAGRKISTHACVPPPPPQSQSPHKLRHAHTPHAQPTPAPMSSASNTTGSAVSVQQPPSIPSAPTKEESHPRVRAPGSDAWRSRTSRAPEAQTPQVVVRDRGAVKVGAVSKGLTRSTRGSVPKVPKPKPRPTSVPTNASTTRTVSKAATPPTCTSLRASARGGATTEATPQSATVTAPSNAAAPHAHRGAGNLKGGDTRLGATPTSSLTDRLFLQRGP